jgi:hypothetical protein
MRDIAAYADDYAMPMMLAQRLITDFAAQRQKRRAVFRLPRHFDAFAAAFRCRRRCRRLRHARAVFTPMPRHCCRSRRLFRLPPLLLRQHFRHYSPHHMRLRQYRLHSRQPY